MTYNRVAVLALALASSVAFAGSQPPSSTTTSFKPEIGYIYSGSNYSDLRLSNVEGTAAILVARSNASNGMRAFDLAPNDVRKIAYIDQGVLKLAAWRYEGLQVVIDQLPSVYTGPGTVNEVEFSPDGSKLAMFTNDPYRDVPIQLIVHDFTTNTSKTVFQGQSTYNMAWHPTLNFLYFPGKPINALRTVVKINTDGPADQVPVSVGNSYGELTDIDTSRRYFDGDFKDGFIVSYRNAYFDMIRTDFYSDDGVNVVNKGTFKATDGKDAPVFRGHFNCANSEILHRIYATRTTQVGIYNIATKAVRLFSSANLGFTDWMPCQYPAI